MILTQTRQARIYVDGTRPRICAYRVSCCYAQIPIGHSSRLVLPSRGPPIQRERERVYTFLANLPGHPIQTCQDEQHVSNLYIRFQNMWTLPAVLSLAVRCLLGCVCVPWTLRTSFPVWPRGSRWLSGAPDSGLMPGR